MVAMVGTPRAKTHSALASPSRVTLIDHIRAADGPLDAHQLARECQLHVTTVRFHLDALMSAGLITSRTASSSGRGRPRLLYSPVSRMTPEEDDGYVTLARLLVRALTGAPDLDAAERAEIAGYDWAAATMTGTVDGGSAHTLHEVADKINALFTELGFESDFTPAADTQDLDITLHSCPFGAVARENPDIVCRIHLGLLRGVLDRLGAGGHHSEVEPWVTPTACRARVSHAVETAANRPDTHPTL